MTGVRSGRDIAEGTIKEIAMMDMRSYKGRQDKELKNTGLMHQKWEKSQWK